jgi:hypothetical protein
LNFRPKKQIVFQIKIICIVQFILFFNAFVFDFLVNYYNVELGFENSNLFNSKVEKIVSLLLMAPIIETLVFNFLINEILVKFLNHFYSILISSFIFALIHYYSIYYALYGLLGGLIFNSIYFYFKQQFSIRIAILVVILLHLNHNLLGLILNK